MPKRMKVSVYSGDKLFKEGSVYDDAMVAHLDPADMEDASAPVEVVTKESSMTTKDMKPKKADAKKAPAAKSPKKR